jgi:hypothetical protein
VASIGETRCATSDPTISSIHRARWVATQPQSHRCLGRGLFPRLDQYNAHLAQDSLSKKR